MYENRIALTFTIVTYLYWYVNYIRGYDTAKKFKVDNKKVRIMTFVLTLLVKVVHICQSVNYCYLL